MPTREADRGVRRWLVLGRLRGLPPVVRLLVLTQLAFNVGFYLVLPFLAGYLLEDLALAGWVVGLVLGVRTASQQGLFVLGGALADRFGTRPVVLAGCTVRIVGFVVLGLACSLAGVLAGVVLVGVAAALFSPAVESALAVQAGELEAQGVTTRSEVFALFAVAGEVGAVTGPLLGALLLGVGFDVVCLVAAGVFVLVLAAHVRWLPHQAPPQVPGGVAAGWRDVLANRVFLLFALGWSAYLVSYNQLYLALPAELTAATGSQAALGWLFALASVLVVAGQVPVTGWARRHVGRERAPWVGLTVMAAAFAACGLLGELDGPAVLPAAALVVLLVAGQVLALPFAQELVAVLARERHLGLHYGLLASAGGVAVLAGSAATGLLLPVLTAPGGALPGWLALGAVPLAGAVLLAALARRGALDPNPTPEVLAP